MTDESITISNSILNPIPIYIDILIPILISI